MEGSYAFRNPSEDMPGDWDDEQRRILHYQELGKPLNAQTFVHSLKERLITALAQFNRVFFTQKSTKSVACGCSPSWSHNPSHAALA